MCKHFLHHFNQETTEYLLCIVYIEHNKPWLKGLWDAMCSSKNSKCLFPSNLFILHILKEICMHIMAVVMRNDTGFKITNFTLQQDKLKIYSDEIILYHKTVFTVGDIFI